MLQAEGTHCLNTKTALTFAFGITVRHREHCNYHKDVIGHFRKEQLTDETGDGKGQQYSQKYVSFGTVHPALRSCQFPAKDVGVRTVREEENIAEPQEQSRPEMSKGTGARLLYLLEKIYLKKAFD